MSKIITNLSYDACENLVMVKLFGAANVDDVVKIYKNITEFAKLNHTNKLLVDVIDLEHTYPAIDVINLIVQIETLLKGFKLARIIGFKGFHHDLVLQKAKRFNVFAENFDCSKKAKLWLNTAA